MSESESESVSRSVVSDSETPWTVAHQALLSMEFSRQKYWNGLPFLPPGDVPDPGIEPASLVFPAMASRFFTTTPPGKPHESITGQEKDGQRVDQVFSQGEASLRRNTPPRVLGFENKKIGRASCRERV